MRTVVLCLLVSLVLQESKAFLGNDPRKVTIWNPTFKNIQYSSSSPQVVNSSIVDWGLTIPDGTIGVDCSEGNECIDYGIAKVVVTYEDNCESIHWTTSDLTELKDCVYASGHWYGGGAQFNEPWPLEKLPRVEGPHVTSDFLRGDWLYGGILESYWVSSLGIAVKVDDTVPLFFSMPDTNTDGVADQLCFSSRYEPPFVSRSQDSPLNLTYHLCYADDVRQVHEASFSKFFPNPSSIPDERMISDPIWSTWAEYGTNINQEMVIAMAQTIIDQGFNNSQIEIDDNWENCYGDQVFDPSKFPDPNGMVDTLHAMGFRVTLWIHPFINVGCASFEFADTSGYFLKDESGQTQLTSWWQGSSSGYIDFTNADAVDWWTQRLESIRSTIGIDSFKFDAGETSWMPELYTLSIDKALWPNGFTSAYVHAVSRFGGMIETRVSHAAQDEPIFIRMLDKSSDWTSNNGLLTLIPSLLHQGIIGYPFVLPDMVGGNGYGGRPDAELFIRWAQSNTFMPSIQFSLFPWEYGNETVVSISRNVSALHYKYAQVIIDLARRASLGEGPMMRPTWWLCPTEEACLTADQQFLLGNDILVTPVVNQGANTLDVVFPPGDWKQPDDGRVFVGPSIQTLSDISIESNIYFVRVGT